MPVSGEDDDAREDTRPNPGQRAERADGGQHHHEQVARRRPRTGAGFRGDTGRRCIDADHFARLTHASRSATTFAGLTPVSFWSRPWNGKFSLW